MSESFRRLLPFFAAAVVGVAPCVAQTLKVGEKAPEFELAGPLHHGDGRRALSEFVGNVVFVEWWGYYCPLCRGAGVPFAVKLADDHAKNGLVCVLIETLAVPESTLHDYFAAKHPGSRCVLATGQTLETDPPRGGPLHAALIGVDGTVLWHGIPTAQQKKIEDLVEAEGKKLRAGWGVAPETKKARQLAYAQGKLGEAHRTLESVAATAPAEVKADVAAARKELDARRNARRRSIDVLKEAGRFGDAQKVAQQLQKDVRGRPDWEKEAARDVESFRTSEAEKELRADGVLGKLLGQFPDRPAGAEAAAALKAFAGRHEGTAAAKRALRLARAATFDPEKS